MLSEEGKKKKARNIALGSKEKGEGRRKGGGSLPPLMDIHTHLLDHEHLVVSVCVCVYVCFCLLFPPSLLPALPLFPFAHDDRRQSLASLQRLLPPPSLLMIN